MMPAKWLGSRLCANSFDLLFGLGLGACACSNGAANGTSGLAGSDDAVGSAAPGSSTSSTAPPPPVTGVDPATAAPISSTSGSATASATTGVTPSAVDVPVTSASSTSESSPEGAASGGAGGGAGATGGAAFPATGGAPVPTTGGTSAVTDAGTPPSAFDGKELFILFGQSNMSGMSPMPEEWPIDENITFMVQYDCPSLGQTKDQWLPAEPPLHGCQWANNGIGLGLADYFGVAMAAAWPDSQIGLIPNAIPAVTIDVFMKGGPSPGGGMKALPDGYTSAYTLMVDRVKAAQEIGRVRGILLHQGESDYNQGFGEEWLGKLATVVSDLRTDLGLGEEVPFLAGQIPPGNYDGHNVYVDQVPDAIPNSAVISSEGTRIHDVAHFDAESARIMGERYAEKFLECVPAP